MRGHIIYIYIYNAFSYILFSFLFFFSGGESFSYSYSLNIFFTGKTTIIIIWRSSSLWLYVTIHSAFYAGMWYICPFIKLMYEATWHRIIDIYIYIYTLEGSIEKRTFFYEIVCRNKNKNKRFNIMMSWYSSDNDINYGISYLYFESHLHSLTIYLFIQ